MGHRIYAWLEEGKPRLRIYDAESGNLTVSWDYQGKQGAGEPQRQEIQRLFKQLLLLTCKQEMANVRVYHCEPHAQRRVLNMPGLAKSWELSGQA